MAQSITVPAFFAFCAFVIFVSPSNIFDLISRKSFLIPGKTSIRQRLAELGRTSEEDYENFRISQLVITLPLILIIIFAFLFSYIPLPSAIFLILLSSCTAFLATERNLSKRVVRRRANIEGEFPSVVEMLTLAVGAGESPATALKRISQRADGFIAAEFEKVIIDLERGATLTRALDEMSHRLNSDSIRRFVDSLIISISRGTPLVETLVHSASESRNQERVRLLTAAGKSEISMMIPVVFLILPISILFALYPSLNSLNHFSG